MLAVSVERGWRLGGEADIAAGMIDIFSAGPRVQRVRFIMWLSLVAAAGAVWFGWELFQSYGSRPADGGVLAPLGVRLAWGLSVAGLGIAFALGMWLYGRLYVWAIGYDEAADRLYVRTLSFFGNRLDSFPAASVTQATFNNGHFYVPGAPSVHAPWYNVSVAGRRFPLIVDAQGWFGDAELVNKALGRSKKGRRRG